MRLADDEADGKKTLQEDKIGLTFYFTSYMVCRGVLPFYSQKVSRVFNFGLFRGFYFHDFKISIFFTKSRISIFCSTSQMFQNNGKEKEVLKNQRKFIKKQHILT